MPSDSTDDRRENPRVTARPPLEVKVLGAKTLSGTAVDLSPGGILLEVDGALLRVGSEVQVKVQLPGELGRILANAVVVRHAGPKRMALRFLRVPSDVLAQLQRYFDAG